MAPANRDTIDIVSGRDAMMVTTRRRRAVDDAGWRRSRSEDGVIRIANDGRINWRCALTTTATFNDKMANECATRVSTCN